MRLFQLIRNVKSHLHSHPCYTACQLVHSRMDRTLVAHRSPDVSVSKPIHKLLSRRALACEVGALEVAQAMEAHFWLPDGLACLYPALLESLAREIAIFTRRPQQLARNSRQLRDMVGN